MLPVYAPRHWRRPLIVERLITPCDPVVVAVSVTGSGDLSTVPPPGDYLMDTSSVGPKTFTVAAATDPGITASCNYQVVYDFEGGDPLHPPPPGSGFAEPLDPNGINVANAGGSIPVKWQLPDGMGGFLPCDPGLVVLPVKVQEHVCDTSEQGTEYDAVTSGQSGLQCDGTMFVYSWKTQKAWAGRCFELHLTLNDGSTHSVDFRLR